MLMRSAGLHEARGREFPVRQSIEVRPPLTARARRFRRVSR